MEYFKFIKILNDNNISLFDYEIRYAFNNYLNFKQKNENINLKKIKNKYILKNVIDNLVVYNETNVKNYFNSIN
jgi:hypothetical protein|tara:strand:+ start:247 stop:468 length:222 start_codon:yes stop_codon:yes gene_type:complete